MYIRLADNMQKDSIVDGVGLRAVIWTQGCPHKCVGCHNPHTQDCKKGKNISVEQVKEEIDYLELQDGITFSGGEPFRQAKECAEIASHAKQRKLNVWSYSGYTFEELLAMSADNPSILDFLKQIDVLIDGRFILAQKDLTLKYRGSTNQRIINVKKSLKEQRALIIKKYDSPRRKNDIILKRSEYLFL